MAIDEISAKDWLKRYQNLIVNINNLIERADMLRTKASSPRSPNLSGMPRDSQWNGDKLSNMIGTYIDLEAEANEKIIKSKKLYKEIDAFIRRIRKPDRKAVLQMKYLDGFSWLDIQDVLFGNKQDYLDKEESYQRRAFKLHQDGVRELAALMGEKELQEIEEFYKDEMILFLSSDVDDNKS